MLFFIGYIFFFHIIHSRTYLVCKISYKTYKICGTLNRTSEGHTLNNIEIKTHTYI